MPEENTDPNTTNTPQDNAPKETEANVTHIPVTDGNDPINPPETSPETPQEPQSPAQDSVPGTPETPPAPAESSAEPQPPAPLPVPATAEPSQDAVTINGHLEKAAQDLEAVAVFVEEFLAAHQIASVAEEIRNLAQRVRNELKV